MEQKQKLILTVLILIAVIVVFFVSSNYITKYTGHVVNNQGDTEQLAKCLSEKQAKMYGAFWCGHCQNQKNSFGESWKYIDYVECDPRGENSQSDLCLSKNIQGYPTWEINNQLYPGEKSFDELKELTGC